MMKYLFVGTSLITDEQVGLAEKKPRQRKKRPNWPSSA